MFEFYIRFRYFCLHHYRHVILHLPAKFRPNRTIRNRVMTSYFKMAAVSHIELSQGYQTTHQVEMGSEVGLKFRLDRIYNFGDIAIFVL